MPTTLFTVGSSYAITCVRFSPGSHYLAAACGQLVKVWDAERGELLCVYQGHDAPVRDLAWSHDGTRIASLDEDSKLHVWGVADAQRFQHASYGPLAATVAWPATQDHCSVRGIWLGTHRHHPERTAVMQTQAWSADGRSVAVACEDEIWVCNTILRQVTHIYQGHRQLVVWPLPEPLGAGACIYQIACPFTVRVIARSPEQGIIASADSAGVVHVWREESGKDLCIYQGHLAADVYALAWSPDSQYIVSAGDDEIKVWEAVSGQTICLYMDHAPAIPSALDWSRDGTRIASGDDRGGVRVWKYGSSSTDTEEL